MSIENLYALIGLTCGLLSGYAVLIYAKINDLLEMSWLQIVVYPILALICLGFIMFISISAFLLINFVLKFKM